MLVAGPADALTGIDWDVASAILSDVDIPESPFMII